jgi:hypothetical protein
VARGGPGRIGASSWGPETGLGGADAVDVFAGLPGRDAPWSARTREDFALRTPPGRSLSWEEAGGLVGLSAFTVRRFVMTGRLPARRGRRESFWWGGRACRIGGTT